MDYIAHNIAVRSLYTLFALLIGSVLLTGCGPRFEEKALRQRVDEYHAAWAKQDDHTAWTFLSDKYRGGIGIDDWIRYEVAARKHTGLLPVSWEVREVKIDGVRAIVVVWVRLGFIVPVDRRPPGDSEWSETWVREGGRWVLDESPKPRAER